MKKLAVLGLAALGLGLAGCGSSNVKTAVKPAKDRRSAPDFALKDAVARLRSFASPPAESMGGRAQEGTRHAQSV